MKLFLPDKELDEKQWTALAIGTKTNPGLARQVGFHAYHTLRTERSEPGYPDWSLFRERHVYLELKTEKGKVSDAQANFIRIIVRAGVEVYVARPHHLQELSSVLTRRQRPEPGEIPEGLLEELALILGPS